MRLCNTLLWTFEPIVSASPPTFFAANVATGARATKFRVFLIVNVSILALAPAAMAVSSMIPRFFSHERGQGEPSTIAQRL